MQVLAIAFGLLVILALVLAGSLYWWLRRFGRKAEAWTKPLAVALELEKAGEYAKAVALLNETLANADEAQGVHGVLAARAAAPHLARVLYRKGDLDESASITQDLLEAALASP